MQLADKETVLGNFNNAEFTYHGITSRFYQKDNKYFVTTDNADGKLEDYQIKYTFGVEPLQQYLIEFPGGRLQALSIAWDSRPKEQGGQRWFHLYPDENITFDDPLHWTGIYQNWNFMCADCHSTNIAKNYDPVNKSFNTTWSEIDVSCETCHGPGSKHLAWASRSNKEKVDESTSDCMGCRCNLAQLKNSEWEIKPGQATASIVGTGEPADEIKMCVQCHSRRGPIHEAYQPGKPLLDHYLPALLTDQLYFEDGQIKDEVYVYGSFIQSKMHHEGVTCSDCHEVHSLKLRTQGNDLCTRCHDKNMFESQAHLLHSLLDKEGTDAARCVTCHMPDRNYMVVDPRRDHSIKVPRPDLSVKLGTPNVCVGCHDDKSSKWAADIVKTRYASKRPLKRHFGEAFYAARHFDPSAYSGLMQIVNDKSQPNIVRATAISLLRQYPGEELMRLVETKLEDPDPVIRLAAAGLLELFDPQFILSSAYPLLNDPVRAIRIEAASVVSGLQFDVMGAGNKEVIAAAFTEYEQAQLLNADRPESQANLGNYYLGRRQFEKSEHAYKEAIRLTPVFGQAYVNLADLYRGQGREDDAEQLLRDGTKLIKNNADLYHSLGLLLVRKKRLTEASEFLRLAAKIETSRPRYHYVYAIALNSAGDTKGALGVLEAAYEKYPGSQEILFGLVSINRDTGNIKSALKYAEKMQEMTPGQTNITELVDGLRQQLN